jgi:hypothetical protein
MKQGEPIGWMYNEDHGAPRQRIHVKVKDFECDFEDSEEGAKKAAQFVTDHVGDDWYMISTPLGFRLRFGKKGAR